MSHSGCHDVVRGDGQGRRGGRDTSRDPLIVARHINRQKSPRKINTTIAFYGAVVEVQDRASHPTGAAVRAWNTELVGSGGRGGQSGLHLPDAGPRPIGAYVGADHRRLSTRRPAVRG